MVDPVPLPEGCRMDPSGLIYFDDAPGWRADPAAVSWLIGQDVFWGGFEGCAVARAGGREVCRVRIDGHDLPNPYLVTMQGFDFRGSQADGSSVWRGRRRFATYVSALGFARTVMNQAGAADHKGDS